MRGREGGMHGGEWAWGMHGRGTHMAGACVVGGHVLQELAYVAGGHAWQGGMHGRG